jgi:hypothetical protein
MADADLISSTAKLKRTDISLEYMRSVLSYDPESGVFTWTGRQWNGRVAGTATVDGYVRIVLCKTAFKAHRLAWALVNGYIPDSKIPMDHLNGIRNDNRICNLRLWTPKQNCENSSKPKSNTTGFKGVAKCKNSTKFRAYICHNRKQIHLGMFNSAAEANKAYCEAAFSIGWDVFKPD